MRYRALHASAYIKQTFRASKARRRMRREDLHVKRDIVNVTLPLEHVPNFQVTSHIHYFGNAD